MNETGQAQPMRQNSGMARFGANVNAYRPATYTPQQFTPRTFNSGPVTTNRAPVQASPGAQQPQPQPGFTPNATSGSSSSGGSSGSDPYSIRSTPISGDGNYNSTGGGSALGRNLSGFAGGMLSSMFGIPAIAGNLAGQGIYNSTTRPTDAGQTTHYSDNAAVPYAPNGGSSTGYGNASTGGGSGSYAGYTTGSNTNYGSYDASSPSSGRAPAPTNNDPSGSGQDSSGGK